MLVLQKEALACLPDCMEYRKDVGSGKGMMTNLRPMAAMAESPAACASR